MQNKFTSSICTNQDQELSLAMLQLTVKNLQFLADPEIFRPLSIYSKYKISMDKFGKK